MVLLFSMTWFLHLVIPISPAIYELDVVSDNIISSGYKEQYYITLVRFSISIEDPSKCLPARYNSHLEYTVFEFQSRAEYCR